MLENPFPDAVISFSREGERVGIRHKDLKKFADPKLESRYMEGIIERFDLYKYKQEGVAYRVDEEDGVVNEPMLWALLCNP